MRRAECPFVCNPSFKADRPLPAMSGSWQSARKQTFEVRQPLAEGGTTDSG